MAAQDPMASARAYSSQRRYMLMSACCARLGWGRPYRFWLGSWPLRPCMLSTPAGLEGRRKRGVSLLCALCVAFTHRHMGCACLCVCGCQCRAGFLWADARSGAGWARLGSAALVADDEWRSPGGLCEGWQAALWGSPTSPAQAVCGINQTSPPAFLSLFLSLFLPLYIFSSRPVTWNNGPFSRALLTENGQGQHGWHFKNTVAILQRNLRISAHFGSRC